MRESSLFKSDFSWCLSFLEAGGGVDVAHIHSPLGAALFYGNFTKRAGLADWGRNLWKGWIKYVKI